MTHPNEAHRSITDPALRREIMTDAYTKMLVGLGVRSQDVSQVLTLQQELAPESSGTSRAEDNPPFVSLVALVSAYQVAGRDLAVLGQLVGRARSIAGEIAGERDLSRERSRMRFYLGLTQAMTEHENRPSNS